MGQFVWEKINSETTLLHNLIILMKVYNMTILAKDCRVKLNGESIYLHGMHVTYSFLLILVCLSMNDIV